MRTLSRLILVSLFTFLTFGFVEQSAMAAPTTPESAATAVVEQVTTEAMHGIPPSELPHEMSPHEGPHIPAPKGKVIEGWSTGGLPITNTIFSTWIFMGLLFVVLAFMYIAIMTKSFPKLRAFGLDITSRILAYTTSLLGERELAKKYIWLL